MSYLLFLCLVGLFYLTQANDCVGMDKAYIDKCLRDKIFLKATKEYLDSNGLVRISIKVDMSGYVLINRTIAIQTRTCSQEKSIARIVGREIDGVYIDYSNKETTYCPLDCYPSYKVCPDGTWKYPDSFCRFDECSRYSYPTPSPTYSYYYPTYYYPTYPPTRISPSPQTLMYSLGVPIIAIVVIVFVAALGIFAIVKCYRRRQALSMQRINEVELNTTTGTSGGTNYYMRTNAGPIASTHPVYLYSNQPSDVSVPMGYVPVLQTNANVQVSSDEMYARELQTKFDQGY